MKLELDIQRATACATPGDADLRAAAEAAFAGRRERAELCIRIVDEAESAQLNRRYRGKSGPTNVLSFPCGVPLPDGGPLGDLAICAPVVAREAAAQGKREDDHWAHLVVHGVLHLLGFDHIGDHDATVMEDQERAALARLDIADPYTPIVPPTVPKETP